jgi:hypothetical protein
VSLRPRQLAFRGWAEAAALLVADSPEGRGRILARWAPGTRVEKTAHGLLLHLPKPERVRCEVAIGLPLLLDQGRLMGAPLSKQELTGLAAGAWIPRGGKLEPLVGEAEEPARWLDLSGFAVRPVEPLQAPRVEVPVALVPREADLRGGIGPKGSPGANALIDALRTAGVSPQRSLWQRFSAWVARGLRRAQQPAPAPAEATGGRGPGWFDRFARWVDGTRVGKWLDERQAAYIDRLLKMFERDELDEALRHAIPLGGRPGTGPAVPALGTPGRREALAPSCGGLAPASTITISLDRQQELRRRYRAAAEKLEKEGKYKEAAFVLADLLEAPMEAVTMLERHQLYTLAAEIAEGRKLAPELVVRLWFLAKEPARAVKVARRTNTFGAAVARLEATHPAEGAQLRLMWADFLASQGSFAAAANVAWSVSAAKPVVLKWLDLAIGAGGPDAGPLRLKRLELDPTRVDDTIHHALTLMADDSQELAPDRAVFADALLKGGDASKPVRRVLVRPAARALIRDTALLGTDTAATLRRVLAEDEGALRTDVPAPAARPPPRQRPTRLEFRADAAALSAFDALHLPGGKTLVTLGENGLKVLGRGGEVTWSSAAPAFGLAVAPGGQLLTAVTPRGRASALSVVQLGVNKVSPWAEVPVGPYAGQVNQGIWFLSTAGAVLGVDVLAARPEALWRVPDYPGQLLAMAASNETVALLIQVAPLEVQARLYALPNLTFVAPHVWEPQGGITHAAIDVRGRFVCAGINLEGNPCLWDGGAEEVLGAPIAGTPALGDGQLAVPLAVEGGVDVRVDAITRLHFERATRVGLRWQGTVLTCAANNGRVVSYDVAGSTVVRQLAVRP